VLKFDASIFGGDEKVRVKIRGLIGKRSARNGLRGCPVCGPVSVAEPHACDTGADQGLVLTSLKEKLIKIGAKVVSHGRYVVFQMAEVAISRQMFQEILQLIAELRPQPPPAPV
jgi:hypothetical protein